jgi:hypothetical protein
MTSITLELRYDDEMLSPLHRGICDSPELDREIILGGQSVDGVETLTSFVYGDADAYEGLLAEQESVLEYDITPDEDGFFLYLRQELGPQGVSLTESLAQDTVVIVPPIEIRSDRTIQMTVVGHPEDLQALSASVPDGITVEILTLGEGVAGFETSLSERQRDALQIAWEIGYFEIPRRNGIEAVAAELDCAVSTASELLRRGQANVIGNALGTSF